jgi:hypothetical protein
MISAAANERIADFYTPNGALRLHQWLEAAARWHEQYGYQLRANRMVIRCSTRCNHGCLLAWFVLYHIAPTWEQNVTSDRHPPYFGAISFQV